MILPRNWEGEEISSEEQPFYMFHEVYYKQYIKYIIRICLGHVKFSKTIP